MSWYARSIAAFASSKPVNPPKTKQDKNVATNTNVQSRKLVSLNANDHAKILTAVGTPITSVAQEKYIRDKSNHAEVRRSWLLP